MVRVVGKSWGLMGLFLLGFFGKVEDMVRIMSLKCGVCFKLD